MPKGNIIKEIVASPSNKSGEAIEMPIARMPSNFCFALYNNGSLFALRSALIIRFASRNAYVSSEVICLAYLVIPPLLRYPGRFPYLTVLLLPFRF